MLPAYQSSSTTQAVLVWCPLERRSILGHGALRSSAVQYSLLFLVSIFCMYVCLVKGLSSNDASTDVQRVCICIPPSCQQMLAFRTVTCGAGTPRNPNNRMLQYTGAVGRDLISISRVKVAFCCTSDYRLCCNNYNSHTTCPEHAIIFSGAPPRTCMRHASHSRIFSLCNTMVLVTVVCHRTPVV